MEKQEMTKEQSEEVVTWFAGCLIWMFILLFGLLIYLAALQCVKQDHQGHQSASGRSSGGQVRKENISRP